MNSLLKKIFPTWIYWLAFVFTIAGVIYSIGDNRPWMGVLVLIPLLISLFHVVILAHFQNEKFRVDAEAAINQKNESDKKLQHLASEKFAYFEQLVSRAAIEEHLDFICEFSAYVGRLQKLSNVVFDLRNISTTGKSLYVAATVPSDALSHLKENDAFLMYVRREGIEHKIAKLRLHQINVGQQSIFFEVSEACDNAILESLRNLAQAGGINSLGDYAVSPDVVINSFQGQDMERVADALKMLKETTKK